MNRNHPYFKSMAPTLLPPVPKQVTTPAPAPITPAYVPMMACVSHPMWMPKEQEIQCLDTIFEKNNTYGPHRGYEIDGAGFIYTPYTGDDAYGGVIAAHAFDLGENGEVRWAPVNIVNTEDAGLRYAFTNKNGCVKDVGPVESACIVGNYDRPEGLYVPMCNTKAMADGMEMLKEMIQIATKDDRDLPPFDPIEEIPMNALPKNIKVDAIIPVAHECACGGECKCGGSCGGNCKCKKNKKK